MKTILELTAANSAVGISNWHDEHVYTFVLTIHVQLCKDSAVVTVSCKIRLVKQFLPFMETNLLPAALPNQYF